MVLGVVSFFTPLSSVLVGLSVGAGLAVEVLNQFCFIVGVTDALD